MQQQTNGVDDAISMERQTNAEEVATAFIALLGDVDAAESVLDRYFALRISCDKEFWREVITALAQVRG